MMAFFFFKLRPEGDSHKAIVVSRYTTFPQIIIFHKPEYRNYRQALPNLWDLFKI